MEELQALKRKIVDNSNSNTTATTATATGTTTTTTAMERHMIFVCPECGQTSDTQNEWRQHLNLVHDYARKKAKDFDFKEVDRKYHECQICLKRLAHGHHSPVLLQYHRFSHLTYGGPFKCRYCAGAYYKKRALSVHLFRCHSQLMNKLDNEYKMEKMKQAIALRHPRFNREFFMRFICPQCGKLFQRFHEWKEHIDKAHLSTSENLCMHRIIGTRDYYCDQCSDTLKGGPTWEHLRRHHFSHLPYSTYFQCAFCITQKSYKLDLFLHFIKYHRSDYMKNKKYICAPDEWAGPAKDLTLKQIQLYTQDDILLSNVQKGRKDITNIMEQLGKESNTQSVAPACIQKDNSSDILQKALRDSCIDLEEEQDVCNNQATIPFNNGQISQETLANAIYHTVAQTSETMNPLNYADLNDYELDEICNEMFEEIEDFPQNENATNVMMKLDNTIITTTTSNSNSQSNKSNKNLDFQKIEMQKYINYLCPECLMEFEDQPTWRSHVFEEHNLTAAVKAKFRPLNSQKSAYLCLSCYQVQRTSKHVELQRHYFQHMPHQGYLKCTLCKKTKSSKPKMIQHLEFMHRIELSKSSADTLNAEPKQCLECDMMFESGLQKHLRECPARLMPLSVTQYDNIAKNMKLLEHLQKASQRIDKMLLEVGIDGSKL